MHFARNIFAVSSLNYFKLFKGILFVLFITALTLFLSWVLDPYVTSLSNKVELVGFWQVVTWGSLLHLSFYLSPLLLFLLLTSLFVALKRGRGRVKLLVFSILAFAVSFTWSCYLMDAEQVFLTSVYETLGLGYLFVLCMYLQKFYLPCRSRSLAWGRNFLLTLAIFLSSLVMFYHSQSQELLTWQGASYFVIASLTYACFQTLINVFLPRMRRRLGSY